MNPEIESLVNALRSRVAADHELVRLGLLSLVRPSIRLVTQRVPCARLDLGDSRIGGVPDLPADVEWPRWLPSYQRDDKFAEPWHPSKPVPLGFIAQIDLGAIPNVDDVLPGSGWLYFFYDRYCEPWGFDPADRGCCRVIYADCDRSALARREPPSDADPEHTSESCLVEAWPELTLPDDFRDIEYGTPAYEAYRGVCDEFAKGGGLTHHRLLGHPQLIQGAMELECQLASNGVYCGRPDGYQSDQAKQLQSGATDWRLLLQVDTDEEGPGWMWGDVGRIYFWIKRQDLSSLRFDDVWLILQCY
jgi:uncharacterized protein YwqG